MGEEAQVSVLSFKKEEAIKKKNEICRFNDRGILHEAEKTSRTCNGRIKSKDGNRMSKSRSKYHERRKADIWRNGKSVKFTKWTLREIKISSERSKLFLWEF